MKTIFCVLLVAAPAFAHDTWLETNTNVIRPGDAIYIDLKLGNHGNDHRDFKLASKVDLESVTLDVIDPNGKFYSVKDRLVDLGYAPTEGYWRAKFTPMKSGIYVVAQKTDKIMHHGRPTRGIKSAKTCFLVSPSLDTIERNARGFDRSLGHPLELVPILNPIAPMGPGLPIAVRLIFKGKPLANARVSFIPQGRALASGFDKEYERMTDADGHARFTPRSGSPYLVAAHHRGDQESGAGFDRTSYSATLTVFVPEMCGCCAE
jgi:uncharacterized GH25 family protein